MPSVTERTPGWRELEFNENKRLFMVFNELCSDGCFRTLWVCPAYVTTIKKLDPPRLIEGQLANTLIECKEPDYCGKAIGLREIFVHESFETVVSALGVSMTSNRFYTEQLRAGREFYKAGLKYQPRAMSGQT